MTGEEETLARAVALLEGAGVPYMVTGSVAASYHGRPRATHDVDVVIDPSPGQLEALLEAFRDAGFYVPVETARAALRDRRQFNVIALDHGTKVDLIIRKLRPFSAAEFDRRQRVDLPFARSVAVVTAEDAVLSKLEWVRRGGDAERHLRDAAGVLEVTPSLDHSYVETWARELGVSDLWSRISGKGSSS
jgi:hypothetical protein